MHVRVPVPDLRKQEKKTKAEVKVIPKAYNSHPVSYLSFLNPYLK